MKNIIYDLFNTAGIALSDKQIELFVRYYDFLIEWNKKINLTSITNQRDAVIKHFIDSALGMHYVFGNVCDIGSGAGFPAIPLKIVNSSIKLTMLDSVRKKVDFLNRLTEHLGLENACAYHVRAEDAARGKYREQFDCVTARAVARLNTLAEYCLPLVKVGGFFVAYKSSDSGEIQEAQKAINILGGSMYRVDNLTLPENAGGRNLIVYKKSRPTPPQYPRGKGKERSVPII